MKLRYSDGYKYQVRNNFECAVEIYPNQVISTRFIVLTTRGTLLVRAGYAWDGPSGPAVDTKNFIVASLVHDALYQLMRLDLLRRRWREAADKELYKSCRANGMSWVRAKCAFWAVRKFAAFAANPKNKKKVKEI